MTRREFTALLATTVFTPIWFKLSYAKPKEKESEEPVEKHDFFVRRWACDLEEPNPYKEYVVYSNSKGDIIFHAFKPITDKSKHHNLSFCNYPNCIDCDGNVEDWITFTKKKLPPETHENMLRVLNKYRKEKIV